MRNCPECGARSPVHDTRDLSYRYKGEWTSIPNCWRRSAVNHECCWKLRWAVKRSR